MLLDKVVFLWWIGKGGHNGWIPNLYHKSRTSRVVHNNVLWTSLRRAHSAGVAQVARGWRSWSGLSAIAHTMILKKFLIKQRQHDM